MARKSKMARIEAVAGRPIIRLYLRVSTDRQAEEGYSLEIQEERLIAYAKSLYGDDVEYGIVRDDGYSGGDLNRPGIQEIIREAGERRITHVIVYKLDRLSRSLKDTMYLIEDAFLVNNVAFVSMQESFDTSTPFGRAMIGILATFAQFERENIFERTRGGMQKRVEQGYWPGGGNLPRGYDYDKKQGILVPNEEAYKVRYVFDQYLAGRALQVIADEIGLRYERAAYNIITNKTYAGCIIYNGVEYKGLHEPLVSLETFEQARALLRERSAKRLVSRSSHLLTGLCYCGKCGAKMRYAPWGSHGYKLICYSQQTSKPYLIKDPDCDQPRHWAADVEAVAMDALFQAAAADKLERARKSIEGSGMEEMLASQLEKLRTKLRRLYNLYGESEDATLLDAINEIKAEISQIEDQLVDEKEKQRYVAAANRTLEKMDGIAGVWQHLAVEEQRLVIASVIDRITISDNAVEVKLKYGLGK